jgi:hypothetical protein
MFTKAPLCVCPDDDGSREEDEDDHEAGKTHGSDEQLRTMRSSDY